MTWTSDELVSEAQVMCPVCGANCYQGLRGRSTLIAHCPPHGVFVTSGGEAREQAGRGWMHCEERLWLIEKALARFLVDPDAEDFMVLQSSTLACNQVLLRFLGGRLFAEVDCREWGCSYCGDQPLDSAAIDRIAQLGFARVPTGPNPVRLDVPRDPRALAALLDDAMLQAYGEDADYEVGIHFKRSAVLWDVLAMLSSGGG